MGGLVEFSLMSWTMPIKSPIIRYSARATAKGSHMLHAIVQASIGRLVSLLIVSMRQKR